ncbi:hypothetical protein [Amycolatopsis eburnea]|uniref:Uncharacterized protein n=1 Tax=Amycolatopsis eburnea TaxID=2267691 RepID=A0A3R9F8A3_9PSEU|nr:hypothetical protein [Amycolatopsis eburnea]RSD20107.1 hypothetical protein EIY87_18020 [Amycolatopsis eburnea]
MSAGARSLTVFVDEDANYHVVGPCTREQALTLLREHAAYLDDPEALRDLNAQTPADLEVGWVLNPVPGIPDGDVTYAPVPAGTPGALPITTSLY